MNTEKFILYTCFQLGSECSGSEDDTEAERYDENHYLDSDSENIHEEIHAENYLTEDSSRGKYTNLIYENGPISIWESAKAILAYSIRHNITGEAQADLFKLIKLHCPNDNRCITSCYKFNKIFNNFNNNASRHYYCSACQIEIEGPDSNKNCDNKNSSRNFFICDSFADQLKKCFSRPGFQEKLHTRFERQKGDEENFEDIWDGKVYQKWSKEGEILSNDSNLSFFWYTDGVALSKSSKKGFGFLI